MFEDAKVIHRYTALMRSTMVSSLTRRELATKKGHAVYARRKAIVEPVFGQMHTLQNAKHLLLRGLDGAKGEWLLLSACHNLRKRHNHIGIDGLAAFKTT